MKKEEVELQNALTNTFLANLAFLSDFNKELYLRVEGLSQLIKSGEYEERYFLEFISSEGEFDIYDNKEKKYVYDKKPSKLIKKAKNLDFTSKGSFSNLNKTVFTGQRFDLNIDIEETLSHSDALKMIFNDASDFVDIFDNKVDNYQNKRYKEFDKFIIIGTLLGRHILSIHKKFKPSIYFICEENLEIFRLSLFVLDYSQLVYDGSYIIFSIMEDDNAFDTKVTSFLSYKAYNNYCVKFFTTDYNVSSLFDKIATVFISRNPFGYSYISSLYNLVNNDSKLLSKYKRVNIKNVNLELTRKPILFLGAGPSLSEEIDWVFKNQDNFIIVSMAAVLNKLINHKIIPDIITTVDSSEKDVLKQFNLDKNLEFIKDKIILASSMTSEKVLENFSEDNIFTFDVMGSFFSETAYYNAYSVGEMTISWLLSLNCKEIYLLGLDLALNQDTGETHISEHNLSKRLNLDDDEFFVEKGGFLNTDKMEVKGNFHSSVYTTRVFNLSLKALNNIMEVLLKDEQKVFNLSKHGAKINKATSIYISDIRIDKNKKNLLGLKDNLNKLVRKGLPKADLTLLDEEEKVLLDIIEFISAYNKKKLTLEDFNDFTVELHKMYNKKVSKLISSKRFLSTYSDTMFMYINYCLNEKKLKDEDKKVEKAISILFIQLKRMISNYLVFSKRVRNLNK